MLEGELVLIEDDGETALWPGDAAGFKAGTPNGHHLVNRSAHEAIYLEIGTRSVRERVHYSDVDLIYEKSEHGIRQTPGAPY